MVFLSVNTPETPVANNDQIIELIQKNLGEVSAGHVDLSQPPAQLNTVLSDFAAPDSVCVEDRFIGQRSTPKEFLNHLWLTGEVYQVISVTKNDAKKITELVVTKWYDYDKESFTIHVRLYAGRFEYFCPDFQE